MRFQPTMFFGQADRCTTGTANGGVSGSFVSGSETWQYFEFTTPDESTDGVFQFELESGFTRRAIVVVVAGGGGGGSTGTGGSYWSGGGGGGGEAIIRTNVDLYPNYIYNIYVGKGGVRANPSAAQPTYNGGNGTISEFNSTPLIITARGGIGGKGVDIPLGTIGDGGDSGNGFLGGNGVSTVGGGGGGSTGNGQNRSSNVAGDGGPGVVYTFPHKSYSVGGGGGGGSTTAISSERAFGQNGGGFGSIQNGPSSDGERSTGGGGGGGDQVLTNGSLGGSGLVFICFPTGSCS